MTLNRNGKLYKFAYFWVNDSKIPDRTNVCRLFWQVIVSIVGFVIAVGMLGVATASCGFVFFSWGWGVMYMPLCRNLTILGVVLVTLVVVLYRSTIREWEWFQLLVAYVKAKKEKFCPIIDFKDEV